MTDDERNNITNRIANHYGVDDGSVNVTVVYKISGTLGININGTSINNTSKKEEVEDVLEDKLAKHLGIDKSNVDVTIVDGVAHFTITTDTFEQTEQIRTNLTSNVTQTKLIEDTTDVVNITNVNVGEHVTEQVTGTVDKTYTSDTVQSVETTTDGVNQLFGDNFNVTTRLVYPRTFVPTQIPTLTRSSNLKMVFQIDYVKY